MVRFKKPLGRVVSSMAVMVALSLSNSSLACSEPNKPSEFPDPATAVSAQMIKAKHEVTAYVNAMQEYASCRKFNSVKERKIIKELESYADSFNQIIREYKAMKKA